MLWGQSMAVVQKQNEETRVKAVKQGVDTDCTIRPRDLRLCIEGHKQVTWS